MTVSSTTTKNSYSGNGSNDTFAYGFKIFDDDDITVIIRTDATGTETVKTKTTHYTVTNVGNASGGNVVFTGGNIPASGETVVLRRTSAQTQTTDYVANDPFPAATHEDALDKLTFLAQEQQEELDRAIKISRTNTMTSTEFTVGATERANKILAFDSSGEIQVTQEIGTFRGNWAASTAYEVRDLVKDTSTNNIFIVNTEHTSSGAQPLTTNANSAKYDLIVDAASATTSATAAASSATAAASSATAAAASETAAATSETNAATSATTATTKASEASTSATSAASSATTATTKASEASTSATNAATSETNAATSATAAAASATAAAASETAAGTSETNAGNSATTATTKASEAATSATTATTKASEASTSATNAASSETAAASSATAAAASQTSAAASAASAASAFDNFDDTYLGSKTSNPTVDNDGDALVAGALYFNSTANEMRVYDGANWIAATSAGNVSLILYEYTATSGQTTFSGSDDNSATLSYTADNLQVVMNGIVLDPSDFTATNGTSVVLASGAATGSLINIYAFKSFTTADMVSKTNGGTFSGNVTFSGNLTADGGTIKLDGNYPTGSQNVAMGDTALDDGSLSGNANTAIGHAAMTANTSGSDNVGVGKNALLANTTGDDNVAVGKNNMDANSTGSNNTALGSGALTSNTTASNNTAAGYNALAATTTGHSNAAMGYNALSANTANASAAFGSSALAANTTGSNSAFGYNSLRLNTTGSDNTAVGREALEANTTASNNTAVGHKALTANTTGTENTAVGAYAGDSVTTATESTFLGYQAGEKATTGTANSFLGRMAGRDTTTGTNNTFVGHNAGLSISTGSKNVVLGSYGGNSGGLDIRTSNNNIVLSDGDGNPRFIVDGNGKSMIGTTSVGSGALLSIDDTSNTANVSKLGIFGFGASRGYGIVCQPSIDTAATPARFLNAAGTEVGSISTTASATSFNTSSDYRLKEAVVDMTGATERLKQLNPVRFNFIADADTTIDGFLAHEVQTVVPEAIRGTHNEVDDDGNPVYQGIDQSKLVPLLVATIQELEARIATLEGAN